MINFSVWKDEEGDWGYGKEQDGACFSYSQPVTLFCKEDLKVHYEIFIKKKDSYYSSYSCIEYVCPIQFLITKEVLNEITSD